MKKYFYISSLFSLLLSCKEEVVYDASGIFEATTVTVSAETPGKILSLELSEGDKIREKETIAVIDTSLLVLQRKQIGSQRQSAVNSSPDISAQTSSLRAQIAHQENECERFSRLLAEGATTQKQYDDAKAYLTTLKAQLSALLSSLDRNKNSISDNASAIRYQAEQIGLQIEKSSVKAPLTGIVLEKYAEPGEYVVPGKPLCKIADMDNVYLRAYFTSSQLASLKLGQKVKVWANYGGDKMEEYQGEIIWISEESEFTPKSIQTQDSRSNLVYAAKVAIKNNGRIKLGLYGEVKL